MPLLDFSEPTWDMALDLYVADAEARSTDVSSLCIASGAPTTTAVRHIKLLIDAGQFVRSIDPADGRRKLINLSPDFCAALERWLDEADKTLTLFGLREFE